MRISSPRQLKDRINNMAKENKLMANTVLQNFMMKGFWKESRSPSTKIISYSKVASSLHLWWVYL